MKNNVKLGRERVLPGREVVGFASASRRWKMLRNFAMTLLLLAGSMPVTVDAVGLGDIRVDSALNQPLDAKIALSSVRASELDTVQVRLASAETFERMGLDRPFILTQLQFTVGTDARGNPQILITTRENIREPFLNFLVEVTWPRGRLVREYTVLLDPPVMMPAPVAPVAAPYTLPGAPVTAEPAPRTPAAPRAPMTTERMPTRAGTWGIIQRGETLWAIAEATRPQGVTNAQMMLAILDANPDAFYGNINHMLAGHVLRIPDQGEILARDAATAMREVQRHNEAWRTGQVSDMRIAAAGPDASAAELRLYAPGTPRDTTADTPSALPGEADAARRRIAELEQELEAERMGREMLTDRLVELESELRVLRGQLEIVDPDFAAVRPVDEPLPLEPKVLEPEVTPEPEPVVEPTPRPVTPPVTMDMDIVDEPDLMVRVMNLLTNPLVLALVIGIPVLVVLGVVALRRKRASEKAKAGLEDEDSDEEDSDADDVHDDAATQFNVGHAAADQESAPYSADAATIIGAASGAAASAPAPKPKPAEPPKPAPVVVDTGEDEEEVDSGEILQLDESDPRNEADFHLAYGLYDQAAELMEGAVKKHPDRTDFRVKLLEIYFAWGKPDEFINIAREGKDDLVVAGEWGTISIFGRQLKEDEPMFSADAAGAETSTNVDLDLDSGDGEAAVDEGFDIGSESDDETPATSADDSGEIDLGDFEYPEAEAEPEAEEAEPEPEKPVASDDLDAGLDFDMDFSSGDGAEATPEVEATPEPAVAAADDDMSLDMDIDFGSVEEPAPEEGESIDLDSALSEIEGEGDDEPSLDLSGDDMGADLDLDAMLGTDDGGSEDDDAVGGIDSQLDLARAFIDMGDADGAKGILEEVLEQGDDKQKSEARELLDMIASS